MTKNIKISLLIVWWVLLQSIWSCLTYANGTTDGVDVVINGQSVHCSSTCLADPNNRTAILQYLRDNPVDGVAPLKNANQQTVDAFIQARRNANIDNTVYNPNTTATNNVGNAAASTYRTDANGNKFVCTGAVCTPISTGNGAIGSTFNNPGQQYIVGVNNGDKYICPPGKGITPENVQNATNAGVCTLVVTVGSAWTNGAVTKTGTNSGSNNPYASSLSAANIRALDNWIATKITSKANTITPAAYANFINMISNKIDTMKLTIANQQKINMLNYIQYEISRGNTAFLDDLLN